MTDDFRHDPPGDEIEDLLPLYAADRLGSRDRARVEMALAVDGDLVRRLELIREGLAATQEAVSAPPEPLPAPVATTSEPAAVKVPGAVEPLMSVPEIAPPPVETALATSPPSASPLLHFIEDFGPRRLVLAGLVAVAAIVLVEAVLIGSALEREPGGVAATVATSSAVVVVGFAPEAKVADVAALLKRHAAQVVDGPRADGTFALRVSGSDAAALAEALRQEREVVSTARPAP